MPRNALDGLAESLWACMIVRRSGEKIGKQVYLIIIITIIIPESYYSAGF
jgi:hypothetical protein